MRKRNFAEFDLEPIGGGGKPMVEISRALLCLLEVGAVLDNEGPEALNLIV